MKFDDVLREIGEFGLYQKRLMFLLCVTTCSVIMQNISPVFTIKIPKHRCKIPTYPNDTYELQSADHASLVNETIPLRNGEYSECTLYDVMESDGTENRTERACNDWVFDKSVFTATLVTELNLVCQRKMYRSHSSMMIFAGKFVGAFLNSMGGDYFGRRRVYTFMMLALIGTSVGIVFVSNLPALMAFRFMAGAFSTGSYLCTYVISAFARAAKSSGPKGKQGFSLLSLFRVPRLLLRYTFLYFCWILVSMTNYGLMLNVSNMSGNIFLNFGIMSALDLFSVIFFALLIERVGRRPFVVGAVGLGGLACTATILPAVLGGNAVRKYWTV
nr:hypothetical protein BaRGS_030576 [Batillaria attramentaria]